MIHWIESQSISAIIEIVFGLCYAAAGVVFGFAAALSRRHIAEQLKAISPVTLTPLAVILGLLIVFLAARVWENVGRANEYIGQEAAALSRVLLLANALPTEVRTKVRTAIIQHVDFVLAQDWPEMATVRANQRTEPVGLTNAMAALFSFTPTSPIKCWRNNGQLLRLNEHLRSGETESGRARRRSPRFNGSSYLFWLF